MNAIVHEGSSPIILGFPHVGTEVPDDIAACLSEEGKNLRDTDWHLDRLYSGVPVSVTTVKARHHRYVIDVNRDPARVSLYPGQNTTDLVPLNTFDNVPIWLPGKAPDEAEIARRLDLYHEPYHRAFAEQIERVLSRHGVAIVFDCHSIRSVIPHLFEGRLPDLNVGDNEGRTCGPQTRAALMGPAQEAAGYTHVLNGRFKGGWTPRHYGKSGSKVEAIKLELAQHNYLASEDLPFAFDDVRAARLRPHLAAMITGLERVALGHLKDNSR